MMMMVTMMIHDTRAFFFFFSPLWFHPGTTSRRFSDDGNDVRKPHVQLPHYFIDHRDIRDEFSH